MKKMMKKAIAFVMAFAMVAGFFAAVGAEEAKAANYSVKVYLKLPDGTAATDWGINTWAAADITSAVTGTTGTVNKPVSWGEGTLPGLTDEGNGFASAVINATSEDPIMGIQFVNPNGTVIGNCWNAEIQKQNLTEAYYNNETQKWYKESSFTTEILPPELDEIFQAVGAPELFGPNWGDAIGQDVNILEKQTDGTFKLTIEAVAAGSYDFKVLQDPVDFGWDKSVWNDAYANGSNMAVTLTEISDVTFVVAGNATDGYTLTVITVKTVLPSEEIEAMIDDLPSVDDVAISDKADVQAVKDAIDGLDAAVKAQVDATKIAKVDALLDKIAELEEEAADTANVILHFKNPNNWPTVSMYAWVEAGEMFGAWPGIAITEDADNEGWYSVKFEYAEDFTVIFNGGGEQTNNIAIDVNEEGKTELWIEMSDETEEGEFGQATNVATTSTEAPAGYVDGDETVVEVTIPEADDETGDDETGDDETGDDETGDDETGNDETGDDETAGDEEDAATAWDDAKLKVHVQMPDAEGWNKLGAYLFGTGEEFGWTGGSGELTGAWPGVELLPEVNSENGWYAFGGTFADGYYMLIINNFVSDEEAAQGAEKLQAADLEITDGEYWLTIALDEETGKYAATVATEAPADYDGEGLESVVENPDEETPDDETPDEETPDEETPDDETPNDGTPDDKDEQPATGDNAPIAVVTMIALVAGAGAVVIRKRRVA